VGLEIWKRLHNSAAQEEAVCRDFGMVEMISQVYRSLEVLIQLELYLLKLEFYGKMRLVDDPGDDLCLT
jgi:hypothetical protein